MTCEARQYSDQMQCACGLAWDMNDPDPPVCRGMTPSPVRVAQAAFARLEATSGQPPVLDPDLVRLIAAARQAEARLKLSTPRANYEGSALQALRKALEAFPSH